MVVALSLGSMLAYFEAILVLDENKRRSTRGRPRDRENWVSAYPHGEDFVV